MSQNDKLELFSKLFYFEKRGNNYMAKSDGAVITIYQNGNHQILSNVLLKCATSV